MKTKFFNKIFLSFLLCFIIFGFPTTFATNGAHKMNIKILYDSTAINSKFQTGWGFSCLINNHLLFDTGADGNALLNNLRLMNVDLSDIDKIITSEGLEDKDKTEIEKHGTKVIIAKKD